MQGKTIVEGGMTQTRQPVGVIGTGLMGTACAKRLLAAGFDVLGYDVDPAKLERLTGLGGRAARSMDEIARACDRVVLAVFSTDQVEQAIEGPQGLVASRPSGAPPLVAICVSTCDPDRIAALAARLPAARLRFVEAPVSGTSDQTARGDALGLVGGDPAAVESVREVIAAIAPRWRHVGAAGNGGRTKLAVNLILGINRAALAEGLVLAERMGLAPDKFLEAARDSAAYSQVMDIKGAKMIAGDFAPQGYVVQSLKDFSLMLEQARRHGQQLPLGEIYATLMEGCIAAGEGEFDNSAVIQEIRRRTS
jgi:3-hydroxyisobutyrate dehydrogenase-like beta-hydroxyacid dehydrogenase